MKIRLSHRVSDAGFLLTVASEGGQRVPYFEWARHEIQTEDGRRAHVGSILRRIEEGTVESPESNADVLIPHSVIAEFTRAELSSLGLPAPATFSVEVRSRGAVHEDVFQFDWGLAHEDGSPLGGFERTGAYLKSGTHEYVIANPVFSLISAMDQFNASSPPDLEARLLAWAEIKELVPEEARVDDYLQKMRVATASALTLRPFINDRGEPDLDPTLGHSILGESGETEEIQVVGFRESLPAARQDAFAAAFRRKTKVPYRYTIGGGWYVVVPERLRRALEVVHGAQASSADERRRFLQKPYLFLKEALSDELGDDVVEELFWEEGYSDRVREIGVWSSKVLPWLARTSGQEWLPPDEVGLRIADRLVRLAKEDIPELIEKVKSGMEQGLSLVTHRGESIPCSAGALESLARLEAEVSRPPKAAPTDEKPRKDQIAVLIKDNLDNLQYERTRRVAPADYARVVPNLKARLLAHQQKGLEWLEDHWAAGDPGALLCDDMGLGKTLQALAFLAWIQATTTMPRPFLVVAPTGLLKNWRDEHSRHFDEPGLGKVVAAYGGGLRSLRRSRGVKELQAGFPVLAVDEMRTANWVLASYETVRDYQHSFARIHWGAVIFDEVQKIKNPAAAMTEAAKALNADFVLALTGTPVENRMADLWSVVDAAWPGRLGALKSFVKRYEPHGEGQDEAAQIELGELRKDLLDGAAPTLILRRLKADHLEGLPQKHIHILKNEMPPKQAAAYERAIHTAQDSKGEPGGMLKSLHELRLLSLHPSLDEDFEDPDSFVAASARLSKCFEIVDRIHENGEKVLLFTESRTMQGVLVELLQRRYDLASPPLLINGTVSGEKRKSKVDEFQDRRGFDVMILSPKAGGVGLTLTAANHVVHLSRWWNPAVEDQCTDRVFRIGQKKPVHIYCPLAIHPRWQDSSFDLQLDSLLTRKRQVSQAVLAPPTFTNAETAELFKKTTERLESAP